MIDFVIPAHIKDFDVLPLSVNGIKNNISCANRIFIVSEVNPNIDDTIYINCGKNTRYENVVSLDQITNWWEKKNPNLSWRSSWIYQQILKLISVREIPYLTQSFIILDADTIFLRDVSFDINKFYYTSSTEKYHLPHLKPIMRLLGLEKTIGFTITAHHGIYHKEKLEEMICLIEKNFNMSFSDAILSVIDYNEGGSFNEQDLYSNYMLLKYPEMCVFRDLRWLNINFIPDEKYLKKAQRKYDFVSCHSYLRK